MQREPRHVREQPPALQLPDEKAGTRMGRRGRRSHSANTDGNQERRPAGSAGSAEGMSMQAQPRIQGGGASGSQKSEAYGA